MKMSENSNKSDGYDEVNNECGVILGYWDQEKTPAVIDELETSIQTVENKCKKLLQELLYYQQYLGELNYSVPTGSLHFTKNGHRNSKSAYLKSTSVPDIAFRKAYIYSNGFREKFHEEFERKLKKINGKLSAVMGKIGVKNNIFLFPTADYVNKLNKKAVEGVEKCLPKIQKEFMRSYVNRTVKSDSSIPRCVDGGISKITRNELEFYKKLSKVNLVRRKCKKLTKRRPISSPCRLIRMKKRRMTQVTYSIGCRRNKSNHIQLSSSGSSSTADKSGKTSKSSVNVGSNVRNSKFLKKPDKSRTSLCNSNSTNSHVEVSVKRKRAKAKKSEAKVNVASWDIDTICNDLVEAIQKKRDLTGVRVRTAGKSVCFAIPPAGRTKETADRVTQHPSRGKKQRCGDGSLATTPNPATCQKKVSTESVLASGKTGVRHNESPSPSPRVQDRGNGFSQYIVTTYPWSPRENDLPTNNDNNSMYNNVNNCNGSLKNDNFNTKGKSPTTTNTTTATITTTNNIINKNKCNSISNVNNESSNKSYEAHCKVTSSGRVTANSLPKKAPSRASPEKVSRSESGPRAASLEKPARVSPDGAKGDSSGDTVVKFADEFEAHEVNRIERKDVWISRDCRTCFDRKYRSRYTKTTPNGFMRYRKSTTEEYTNGRESFVKSESKTEAILVSDTCKRPDFYGLGKQDGAGSRAGSGDNPWNGQNIKLKEEWSRILSSLSTLCRNYASLKESTQKEGFISEEKLNAMEREIDQAIDEYTDFLKYYSKNMQVKQPSTRHDCKAETLLRDTSQFLSANYQRKPDSKKPTHSMVLRETLKQIQTLQNNIRLVNDF